MSKDKIKLFQDKKECCGCGACMNICPQKAICMTEDEYGFIYPKINYEKCIGCGACKSVCAYQDERADSAVQKTYVAVAKDKKLLEKSASGGVFTALATEVLKRGGVVFGCSMEIVDDELMPKHIMIEELEKLTKLQGSKYVQSFIGETYSLAKEQLEKGKLVLFSGTPCQVDGLKHYLKKKIYDNLLTIDLVCHGVPNAQMFQSYLRILERKLGGKVIDFKFRDKANGWGLNGKIIYRKNGKIMEKVISSYMSSYYKLFLESVIYRENCYSCQYANSNRVGDLTIGDFWGIETEHPEYLDYIDIKKGVSCIIANNSHGIKMLKKLCLGLELRASTFEKVSKTNQQLKYPSARSSKREIVLELYKNDGYKAVEKWEKKSQGIKYYVRHVKQWIRYIKM